MEVATLSPLLLMTRARAKSRGGGGGEGEGTALAEAINHHGNVLLQLIAGHRHLQRRGQRARVWRAPCQHRHQQVV